MSNSFVDCIICGEEVLESCTAADYQPRTLRGKIVCEECYREIKLEILGDLDE